MDANGGNTAKKWQRETPALELITAVPWQLAVQFANKYVLISSKSNLHFEFGFFYQKAKAKHKHTMHAYI